MNYTIEAHAGGTTTLAAFAEKHGLEMLVVERRKDLWLGDERRRYYAWFKSVDVGDSSVLIGAFGDGASPEEAISAYARRIEGKKLVVDAFHPTRREIDAPNELLA